MIVWVATFAWFVSVVLLPLLVIFWQVVKVIARRAEKKRSLMQKEHSP